MMKFQIFFILSFTYIVKPNILKSSSFYNIKYISNKSFSTSTLFDLTNQIDSNSNLAFLRCLDDCLNNSNCSSVVYTKYNISFSICSFYKNSPNIYTDLVTSDNYVMYQKILKSNFLFFFLI